MLWMLLICASRKGTFNAADSCKQVGGNLQCKPSADWAVLSVTVYVHEDNGLKYKMCIFVKETLGLFSIQVYRPQISTL